MVPLTRATPALMPMVMLSLNDVDCDAEANRPKDTLVPLTRFPGTTNAPASRMFMVFVFPEHKHSVAERTGSSVVTLYYVVVSGGYA